MAIDLVTPEPGDDQCHGGVPPGERHTDAPRDTSAAAVAALHEAGAEVVMLTGDNEATARRIAERLGIDTVIAEVLPADKAAKIAALSMSGSSFIVAVNALELKRLRLPGPTSTGERQLGRDRRQRSSAAAQAASHSR